MNTKTLITRTVVTFALLTAAGILMVVGAKTMPAGADQTILISVGSALFGAALAFFLVRIFSITER